MVGEEGEDLAEVKDEGEATGVTMVIDMGGIPSTLTFPLLCRPLLNIPHSDPRPPKIRSTAGEVPAATVEGAVEKPETTEQPIKAAPSPESKKRPRDETDGADTGESERAKAVKTE